jgi:DNA polymerase-3 subunit delta
MTYNDLERQIAAQKISFAYFFPGEEEYLKDQAIRKIAVAYLGETQVNQGLESISATEQDGINIVQRTQSLGMFSEMRVIAVKEIEALSVKSRKLILEYLDSPCQDVCLILCSVNLDKKTAFYKGLAENIPTLIFNPLKESETVRWVGAKASAKGLKMLPQVAQLLVDISGNNLGILDKEIEKLEIYLIGKDKIDITEKDIKSLAGSSFEVESYELSNAICNKEREKSLKLYQQLLESGEDPVRLVSAIYYQMEKLWKVALLSAQGVSARQIGYNIQSHEYYVNQMIPVARKRDLRQYLSAMNNIYRVEFGLKSGMGDPRSLVQALIYKLAS